MEHQHFLSVLINYKRPFSIAMLFYQRVLCKKTWTHSISHTHTYTHTHMYVCVKHSWSDHGPCLSTLQLSGGAFVAKVFRGSNWNLTLPSVTNVPMNSTYYCLEIQEHQLLQEIKSMGSDPQDIQGYAIDWFRNRVFSGPAGQLTPNLRLLTTYVFPAGKESNSFRCGRIERIKGRFS